MKLDDIEEYDCLERYRIMAEFLFPHQRHLQRGWRYHSFVTNEKPLFTRDIIKNQKNFRINIYKGSWCDNSLSFWCTINTEPISYFIEVRYNFTWETIQNHKVYHWQNIIFYYKLLPNLNYTSNNAHPYISDAELLEVMEQFLEAYPNYDYRFEDLEGARGNKSIYKLFPKRPSFLYLVQCKETNTIKLGNSSSPKSRFYKIDSDSPTEIQLLASIQCDYAEIIERLLKEHFKYTHKKKEWFYLTKKEVNRILEKKLPYPINKYLGEVEIHNPFFEKTK